MSEKLNAIKTLRRLPIAAKICRDLAIAADQQLEVFRYLGYPAGAAPKKGIADRIAATIAEALPLLRPRGVFALYPIEDRTSHSLTLSGATISGGIGEFLSEARRVAVFVVTVGIEISDRAHSDSKSGDTFSAWVMDAVGSWAAESAADALMLQLRPHLGENEELTLRYSPGYCGMELALQRNLFRLVDATSIGVRLSPTMLMHPLKSISGLVGLAPKEAVDRHRSPCDLCPRTGCHMRRAS